MRDRLGSFSPIGPTSLSVHLRRFSRCFRQRLLIFFTSLSRHCLMIPETLSLSHLDSLVIDEADLILSYGHDEDIRSIFSGNFLPKVYQSFLMSATMTDDVETLKGLALRNPVRLCPIPTLAILVLMRWFKVTLNMEEDEDEAANLVQYVVRYFLFLCCRSTWLMTCLKDNGSRQILVDLHHSQTQAHSGEMHHICQRCRSVLSCQTLP